MLRVRVVALLSAPLGRVVEVLCEVVPEYRGGFCLIFVSTSLEYGANISTYCITGSILNDPSLPGLTSYWPMGM